MALPDRTEILTADERLALSDALGNASLMSGLGKIFHFEEKYQNETMSNEALAPVVNTNRIIQAAARAQGAREIVATIRKRMETLSK